MEEHVVCQTVGISDLQLRRIDIKVGKVALVQQGWREKEMETFHPVRKLEMALLRSHWYEIAHARSGNALLNLSIAGAANYPAAGQQQNDLRTNRDGRCLAPRLELPMFDAQSAPRGLREFLAVLISLISMCGEHHHDLRWLPYASER